MLTGCSRFRIPTRVPLSMFEFTCVERVHVDVKGATARCTHRVPDCRLYLRFPPIPQFIYTMKGLGKVYPPDVKVLEDIWLSFLPGAKIGVLRANGAGKSSLLRIMAGEDHEFLGEAFPA